MLIYSNHRGMPNDVNVYYDPDDKYPWHLGIISGTYLFKTADELIEYVRKNHIDVDVRKFERKARKYIFPENQQPEVIDGQNLGAVLQGFTITDAEPINYPLTDGVLLSLFSPETGDSYVLEIGFDAMEFDPNSDSSDPPLKISMYEAHNEC
ncbi:MAG: hypothetical protein IJV40_03205 [Oscillospiraceae bacterium]|nr:hypothetical protein [Oscillospiraceae bacterium]